MTMFSFFRRAIGGKTFSPASRTEPAFTLQPTRKPADGPRGTETFLEQVAELEQPDMELLKAAFDVHVEQTLNPIHESAGRLVAFDADVKSLIRAMVENDPEGAEFALRYLPYDLDADAPGVSGHA